MLLLLHISVDDGKRPGIAGKPYLLHFWAEWSPRSSKDFAILQTMATEVATIIGVHPAGSKSGDVTRIITENKLNYPTVIAPV